MTDTDKGNVSDGYHTFNELYEHRAALFVSLMRSHPEISWFARKHHDGSEIEGFFIAGMNLPTGQITYHLKTVPWLAELWNYAGDYKNGMSIYCLAPEWDGHTPATVVARLTAWETRKLGG